MNVLGALDIADELAESVDELGLGAHSRAEVALVELAREVRRLQSESGHQES